jgi:VanZ family protein
MKRARVFSVSRTHEREFSVTSQAVPEIHRGLLGTWFDWRYALLTLSALGAIAVLSSIPELGTGEADPLVALASNLAHMPAFGILAFLLLKTISGGRPPSWDRYVIALLGSATYAVVDEWHQSLVPGRHSSAADFLLDLAGICGVLLFMGMRSSAAREVGAAPPHPVIRQ